MFVNSIKRGIKFLAAALMVAAPLSASGVARADSYYLVLTVAGPGTCTNTTFSIPISEVWNLPTSGVSQNYADQVNGVTLDHGTSSFYTGSGSLGPINTTPSTAYNLVQPYTFIGTADVIANGTVISHVTLTIICNGNVASGVATNSSTAPSSSASTALVLHTITCTTPVYDAPDGNAVSNTKILAGQTWFVNPSAVIGPSGAYWTAINVGGSNPTYIPTVCVN